jgi:hypothetical protein
MQTDIRDLWKRQDLQPIRMSPEELRKKSRRLKNNVRVRTVCGFLAAAFVFVSFTTLAVQMPDWPRRFGASLTAVAAFYFIYQVLQGRSKNAPSDLGTSASVDFYRQEIERQRDFHQGWRFWTRAAALYPGYLLFCWGSAVAEPASAHAFAWIAVTAIVLGAVGIALNLAKARKYQRLIGEMDSTVANSDKRT